MFITLEGPEGGGKSTQLRMLSQALRALGCEVVATREPGGVPSAEQIRGLVLHHQLYPETEALLFLAARAEHARALILPALERGAVVLCDRFNDSTIAYQGYGLGLDVERLRELCAFASAGLTPELTILLDVPAETGLQRRLDAQLPLDMPLGDQPPASQTTNKLDHRPLAFHLRVRDGFLREAERDPARIYRIDATRSPRQVHAEILREAKKRLKPGSWSVDVAACPDRAREPDGAQKGEAR